MIVAGIDVGKANLDVSVSEGPVIRFDNTVEGIAKLVQHLAEQDATVAVCESTGGYERLVVGPLAQDWDTYALGPTDPGTGLRSGLRVPS